MIKGLFTFLLINTCFAASDPSIYLCSRLNKEAQEWNNVVTKELDGFDIFRPQDLVVPYPPRQSDDHMIFLYDLEGMKKSDILLVLPPYGRDCSWEIGWFCGQNRLTIAYAEKEGDWIRDAMVKGGLSAVITNNASFYEALQQDEATHNKCHLIHSKEALGEAIRKIWAEANP